MTDKETLEELKSIISNKPDDKATHIDSEGDCCRVSEHGDYQYYNGTKWVESGWMDGIRSLSDIEEIIELREQVKSGYEAYARIEAVNQRYNAENRQLREFIAGLQLSVSDELKANELLGVDNG